MLSILFATDVFAVDWSDCASELDRLRRASRDAADYAETANSRKDDLESEKDDLESERMIWKIVLHIQIYMIITEINASPNAGNMNQH